MNNSIHLLQTQTRIQMQSNIITTESGKVIAIDGGHRQDACYFIEYLKQITGQDKPHIDAWFFTHAHDDHMTCFYEIVENHWDEIEVDKIYYNFPSAQFFSRVPHPDKGATVTAQEFYDLLPRFADKVCIVFGGDKYEIGEAKIDILYTPDYEIEANVCNNSSIVFKVTIGEKTILMLGDAGIESGNKLLKKYAGTGVLKADVCQMAHHGQNGVTKEFYAEVAPEVCLWCAPKWLWENDAGKGFNTHCFKTVEVRQWMDEIGTVKKNVVDMDGTQEHIL